MYTLAIATIILASSLCSDVAVNPCSIHHTPLQYTTLHHLCVQPLDIAQALPLVGCLLLHFVCICYRSWDASWHASAHDGTRDASSGISDAWDAP